jgi:hypothetical protein
VLAMVAQAVRERFRVTVCVEYGEFDGIRPSGLLTILADTSKQTIM